MWQSTHVAARGVRLTRGGGTFAEAPARAGVPGRLLKASICFGGFSSRAPLAGASLGKGRSYDALTVGHSRADVALDGKLSKEGGRTQEGGAAGE